MGTRRRRKGQKEGKVKMKRMGIKKEEKLRTGSVHVTISDKRKQKRGMGRGKEKGPRRKEKSHLREGEVKIGEGVEREGEDHPLLLQGERDQEIDGGDRVVRLVSISVLL